MDIGKEISLIYHKLCGEYPGAVVVRHGYKKFREMVELDHERCLKMQARNMKKNPTNIQFFIQEFRKGVHFLDSAATTGTSNQQQPNPSNRTVTAQGNLGALYLERKQL